MRTKAAAFIAATALVGALNPMPGAGAGAAGPNTYNVQVGAVLSDDGKRVAMRFYPAALQVAQGDVVHFEMQGLHTATLLPSVLATETDVDQWLTTYAPPRDGAFSLFHEDSDEQGLKLNPSVVVPTHTDCGVAYAPCAFDATGNPEDGLVNSGLPIFTTPNFYAAATAPAGTSFWVQDLAETSMRMKIDVVATPALTPAQVDTAATQAITADRQKADGLHATWSAKKPTSAKKNGVVTKTMWAGHDEDGISLNYFYPSKITVKKGQRVKWLFPAADQFSSPTVTFSKKKGLAIAANRVEVMCDTDGNGGAADTPANEDPAAYCDEGDVEFDIPTKLTAPAGDGIWKGGKDFESSGVRGAAPFASDVTPYVLKFPVVNSKGFGYVSMTSPNMAAKVAVTK